MPTPSTPPRPTRPSGDTTTYPPAPPAVSGAAPGHLGGCVVFLLRNLLRSLLRSLLFAMTSIAVVHIGGAVREAGLQLLQGEGHSVAAPAALAVVEVALELFNIVQVVHLRKDGEPAHHKLDPRLHLLLACLRRGVGLHSTTDQAVDGQGGALGTPRRAVNRAF